MNKKIAVINITSFGREFPQHIAELEKEVGPVEKMLLAADMEGTELADRLNGFTYVLLGNYPQFSEAFFEHNKTVKLIARHGIGYNNIDLQAARKAGVIVTKMPNIIEVDAVAEQAVALLVALAKKLSTAQKMVLAGEWNTGRERIVGHQLRHAVTGVIGLGNIGKRFAEIMKQGFQNEILVCDPFVSPEEIATLGYQQCSLEELLEKADFISLHVNLTPSTYHLIHKENIALIKQGAILINTARGDVVDEEALIAHFSKTPTFAYGADVMSEEPAVKQHPLLAFSNVLVTPHAAIYNLTCMKQMNRKVMEDIYMAERGQRPAEILDELE